MKASPPFSNQRCLRGTDIKWNDIDRKNMGINDIRKIERIEKNEDRNIELNNERKKEKKREVIKHIK